MSAILLIPYALLVSSRRAILSTAAACALDFVDLLQRIAALAARTTRTTINQPQHRPCIKDIRNKTRSINRGALQEVAVHETAALSGQPPPDMHALQSSYCSQPQSAIFRQTQEQDAAPPRHVHTAQTSC